MCRGCEAHKLTITVLQSQLDKEKERADKFEALLLQYTGLVTAEHSPKEISLDPIFNKKSWAMIRRELEANDRKKAAALNNAIKALEPEGQEL
jgi:hypothetical protein